ncbi:MAG: hypothetical protein ACRC7N_07140 [Clostridium sp.]
MQNNDLIGKVVLSTAGRDSGKVYVISQVNDDKYISIVNGSNKTMQKPKRKKLKHTKVLYNGDLQLIEAILNNKKSADLKIKRFLKVKGIVKEG